MCVHPQIPPGAARNEHLRLPLKILQARRPRQISFSISAMNGVMSPFALWCNRDTPSCRMIGHKSSRGIPARQFSSVGNDGVPVSPKIHDSGP